MSNNKQSRFEDLAYWKNNAEENYMTTPISVLKYIHKLEKHIETIKAQLPSDEEVWRWWQTQKFQKEQGEQEYTMLYEIDLPKILKSFTEHLIKGGNNEQQ